MAESVQHNREHDERELKHDIAAGHETSDVGVRAIMAFLAGLVVSLAIVIFFLAWLFGFYQERADERDPPPVAASGRTKGNSRTGAAAAGVGDARNERAA